MKIKATKKEIKEKAGANVYAAGYCEIDYLLKYYDPFAYSAGLYGWSCDYYSIKGVVISTGYRPIGKSIDFRLIQKYNKKASGIYTREGVEAILVKFIKEITKGGIEQ